MAERRKGKEIDFDVVHDNWTRYELETRQSFELE